MSSYRETEKSESYIEAVQAIEGIDPPAVGFTKAKINVVNTNSKLVKQNNLIIQLLVKLVDDNRHFQEEFGEIKRSLTTLLKNKDTADTLEEVVKKLENWKPGESGKPLIEKKQGPFFVFEDPVKIYQREKEKSQKK